MLLNLILSGSYERISMTPRQPNTWSSISTAVFLTGLIVGALLIYEHRIHILGFMPFAFLSTCIVMYLFMHHGHGRHRGR
jgi:hypothetical protein